MEMEETQVPAPDPFIPPDVKAPKKSLTNRYSEIFRDFDNFQLSVYPGVEEPDPDSQSLPENSSEPSENPELENPENPECEDACCPEIRTDVCEKDGGMSAQDADLELCRCEGGVELALQYAKMWCRYAKDLLTWMDKRISLEQEFSKNIMKAAEAAKSCVAQQDMMPLRYIYTMALEQDVKNSASSRQTADLLQQRCYQGLAAKKNEIDKWRREFKEQWSKQQRRMNEAAAALKKARHQYLQRCEDLEKAKAVKARAMDDTSGHKTLDRRRKSRDDAQLKVTEAEKEYRQCVSDAKANQEELERVKERIVVHTRKLICQGDTVLKETTVNMFYFQRLQTAPVPEGYHCLEVSCRPCQPGESYLDYILSRHLDEQPRPEFAFQEFVPQGKSGHRKTSNSTLHPVMDSDGRRARYSDPESMGGSWESLSSPAHVNRRLPKVSSFGTISSEDLDERDMGTALESEGADGPVCKLRPASRAALTHRLRKMKSKMVKCKQCDNYIVVNGIECEECSLAVHRKCLEVCQLECEQRKGSLFGVDFPLLPRERPDQVPFLVLLCTAEIESRALAVQGVYRVSGSKPRVQKLCQAFEAQKEQVDLSDISPHDLTSVLKHFFKELPEPLLTFDLYNDFISVGKEIQHAAEREAAAATVERIVLSLRELLRRLAPYRYSTLQHMMAHLHRVAENFEENKMSAGNLGIVFGPTLLRPLVSVDVSMVALLETSYQALLVEFLVAQHRRVFGTPERPCTPPPPPPTAPLPDTPPRGTSCPPATEGGALTLPLGPQEPGNPSSRGERPRSLDTGTIKRDSSEGYISDKSSSNEAVDQLSAEANERAVLALRAAMAARPADLPVETDAPIGPWPPLYHLSKQPSEHRGHVPLAARAPRPRTGRPGGGGTPATSAERRTQTGSAESSCSSSPEPGRHAPQRHATNQTHPPYESEPPPPQAAQERRGLGVASALANPTPRFAREEEGLGIQASSLANLNVNQSNNRLRVGERWSESRSTRARSGERTLTGPAQKILSGLKQRRGDSGKEQFHFV